MSYPPRPAVRGWNNTSDHPDCTSCHMPFKMGTIVAHTQTTDHRILRKPSNNLLLQSGKDAKPECRAAPSALSRYACESRQCAPTCARMGVFGRRWTASSIPKANRLLQSAVRKSPNDSALLSALGYVEQKRGDIQNAAELYERALKLATDRIDAAMNLGVIYAQTRMPQALAVALWRGAFERAPWRSAIGMNWHTHCAALVSISRHATTSCVCWSSISISAG